MYVQKRYPKIRAEYAVFDRMIMFYEEDENGCVEKEFQNLKEVENYYGKMWILPIKTLKISKITS